jgi:hypothetical protein
LAVDAGAPDVELAFAYESLAEDELGGYCPFVGVPPAVVITLLVVSVAEVDDELSPLTTMATAFVGDDVAAPFSLADEEPLWESLVPESDAFDIPELVAVVALLVVAGT